MTDASRNASPGAVVFDIGATLVTGPDIAVVRQAIARSDAAIDHRRRGAAAGRRCRHPAHGERRAHRRDQERRTEGQVEGPRGARRPPDRAWDDRPGPGRYGTKPKGLVAAALITS